MLFIMANTSESSVVMTAGATLEGEGADDSFSGARERGGRCDNAFVVRGGRRGKRRAAG